MQKDKSAQQRWWYQGVSEAPCGEHTLFQADQRNAIEYKVNTIEIHIPRNTMRQDPRQAPTVSSRATQCNALKV